jgi:hypothetical protein
VSVCFLSQYSSTISVKKLCFTFSFELCIDEWVKNLKRSGSKRPWFSKGTISAFSWREGGRGGGRTPRTNLNRPLQEYVSTALTPIRSVNRGRISRFQKTTSFWLGWFRRSPEAFVYIFYYLLDTVTGERKGNVKGREDLNEDYTR